MNTFFNTIHHKEVKKKSQDFYPLCFNHHKHDWSESIKVPCCSLHMTDFSQVLMNEVERGCWESRRWRDSRCFSSPLASLLRCSPLWGFQHLKEQLSYSTHAPHSQSPASLYKPATWSKKMVVIISVDSSFITNAPDPQNPTVSILSF